MRGLYLLTCFVFVFQLIGKAQTIATVRDRTNWNDQMAHNVTNQDTRTIADQIVPLPYITRDSTFGRVLGLQHSGEVDFALADFRLGKMVSRGREYMTSMMVIWISQQAEERLSCVNC